MTRSASSPPSAPAGRRSARCKWGRSVRQPRSRDKGSRPAHRPLPRKLIDARVSARSRRVPRQPALPALDRAGRRAFVGQLPPAVGQLWNFRHLSEIVERGRAVLKQRDQTRQGPLRPRTIRRCNRVGGPRCRATIKVRCARRSWRVPAGESPARVRGSAGLVVSVAAWKATTTAKRTQQSCGVWE
jgi:hypothetical protein